MERAEIGKEIQRRFPFQRALASSLLRVATHRVNCREDQSRFLADFKATSDIHLSFMLYPRSKPSNLHIAFGLQIENANLRGSRQSLYRSPPLARSKWRYSR